MATLSVKAIAIAVVIASLLGLHYVDKHYAVQEAITATTSSLNTKYDKSLKEANEKALRASNDLQASADKKLEEKDAKIKTIGVRLDSALSELRNRPYRPSDIATNPGPVQACTATGLYREDAEFLTREAARAASVVAERDYYYEQYEEVRKKINGDSE